MPRSSHRMQMDSNRGRWLRSGGGSLQHPADPALRTAYGSAAHYVLESDGLVVARRKKDGVDVVLGRGWDDAVRRSHSADADIIRAHLQ